jgi:N4-bis(aminopropyl)spermidine synthase
VEEPDLPTVPYLGFSSTVDPSPTVRDGAPADGVARIVTFPEAPARNGNPLLKRFLKIPLATADREVVTIVESARPRPLRAFDQIPMRGDDLARQAKLIGPALAGKSVAFVGDLDGAATLFGLLRARGAPAPRRMLVLDFDARVLAAAVETAHRYGFADCLEVRQYNVFDPLPVDVIGHADCFYTNPPYGSNNQGASGRLFITRGMELVRATGGSGCLLLPDDRHRRWTRRAMLAHQRFLADHGWTIREKLDQVHRYHLDDDPNLASSLILIDCVGEPAEVPEMPFAGRRVGSLEIPGFYGRDVVPPFPRYIGPHGEHDYNWT